MWIIFFNLTAPLQTNKTFTGHITISNIHNESDVEIINASLSTGYTSPYMVTEHIIGLIRNLSIQQNKTSFHMIVGLGARIIDYGKSGKVAFLIPYCLTDVKWIGNYTFNGKIRPFFIKGTVQYKEYGV
jgi:hypothetical protein